MIKGSVDSIETFGLVDGPGIRTVLFMQGCDIHCPGCQNPTTWDIKKGIEVEIETLVEKLDKNVINKKITISGGEPLLQKEALLELVKELNKKGFDIALYTGHKKEEVPEEIIQYLTYLKTGNFIKELETTVKPFVGSTNQEFMEVKHDEETLRNQVEHLVLDFRKEYVQQRLSILKQQIALSANDMERMRQLMEEYKEIQSMRNTIARELGNEVMITR